MGTLYERIQTLCKSKGISVSRMCLDLGLSKSTLSDLKNGRTKGFSVPTAQKISAFFGITVDELYGEATKNAPTDGERKITDDDIKFALFGGDGEITDSMYQEVRNFADYVRQREAQKKKE